MKDQAIAPKELDKISVGFVIRSHDLDPATVTVELGLKPTNAYKREDLVSPGSDHKRPWGLWALDTEGAVDSDELQDHIDYLLDIIFPKQSEIQKYMNDPTCYVAVRVDWQLNYYAGGYSVSASRLRKIATLCNHFDYAFLISEPNNQPTN